MSDTPSIRCQLLIDLSVASQEAHLHPQEPEVQDLISQGLQLHHFGAVLREVTMWLLLKATSKVALKLVSVSVLPTQV
jgi:hypothetical protein